MWSLTDESLLAGLASGDQRAATAFVRRYQRRVYGLALTILRDPATAEEVAQETFLKAWRHAAAFDARRGSVPTWLLSIARNVAIDVVRSRRQEPLDPEVLAGLRGLPTQEGPGEESVQVDDRERLRAALAGLPEEQRRALVLASFYGRSAREIGDMEGIPLGTAKTRIRAGMIKVRAALEVPNE